MLLTRCRILATGRRTMRLLGLLWLVIVVSGHGREHHGHGRRHHHHVWQGRWRRWQRRLLMLMLMMVMWMRMLMLVRMLVWMRMLLLPGYLDLHVVLRIRGAANRQRQVKTFAAYVEVCVCVSVCVREGVFVSAAPAPGGRMACAQYHLRIATDRGACGQWQAWPTLWHAARIKFHALLRGWGSGSLTDWRTDGLTVRLIAPRCSCTLSAAAAAAASA